VVSDKSMILMWGSDGDDILKPHLIESYMEGDGGDAPSKDVYQQMVWVKILKIWTAR
jgi:hypothetical protein